MAKQAAREGKDFQAGPNDPEHVKIAAGVGVMVAKGNGRYQVQKPTKDYLDAVATGRCIIVCADINGCTFACANLYGWTGAKLGNEAVARTNDLTNAILMQFNEMRPGPKAICGDINGPIEALPAINEMIQEKGWRDVGNNYRICHGRPGTRPGYVSY